MNREIKFRAWNKKECQMFLSPKDIRHLGSWLDAHLPGALAENNNIVIMQYTGLKDKNDNDIYEGDLLKNENITYEVEWHTQQGCWWLNPIFSSENDDFILLVIESGMLGNGYLKRRDLEVIGDKYNNK